MHVSVRPYTQRDFDALLDIQREAFPPPFPEELWWSPEQVAAHVETFPEGAMLVEANRFPVGSATSLIIRYDGSPHTWSQISDNGMIKNTHNAMGDSLYGIDLCVRPSFRRQGIAQALYTARKNLVIEKGLTRFLAGCRIPGYYQHAPQMTPEEYVIQVTNGQIHDMVLSFMIKQGLTPLQILPEYVEDGESLDYAVLVEWRNPQ
ncbi:GNAT family N-acetyltransferase [Aneurinibacillus uraniidurans]|uniref:GNAT family N-acetyltransferase n=1 Tax=Aneurinibacillus uraniidurans TaxID=2966586 RepID=UPI00234B3D31|nr:GNAT family N-acetyltransferase [Aneurinibacillus sp. B1]WCN37996.1 GNAT family N-acetyltransferase [Aneurinibacillus sp. B1]